MKRFSARSLTEAAAVAALYAALALLSSAFGLGFGAVQLRLSEALTLLPLLYPSSVWGLTVGCLLADLFSPFGLPDLIVGTAATLLAAALTAKCRRPLTAGLPPVALNALAVGAVLAWEESGFSAAALPLFLYHALTVAAGEALTVYALGVPLLRFLKKKKSTGGF